MYLGRQAARYFSASYDYAGLSKALLTYKQVLGGGGARGGGARGGEGKALPGTCREFPHRVRSYSIQKRKVWGTGNFTETIKHLSGNKVLCSLFKIVVAQLSLKSAWHPQFSFWMPIHLLLGSFPT